MRLTEKEMVKQLWESAEKYKPLIFKRFEEKFSIADRARADVIAEVSIENGPSFRALIKIKTAANPKTLLLACKVLRDELNRISEPDLVPVIAAPYIGSRQAGILAEEGISWLDLSGNMRIQIPNRRYLPDTLQFRKISQGTFSLASKTLLSEPDSFSSQSEISAEGSTALIDFSDNMRTKAPSLYIERTGNLNKFPDTAPIKKIFQGVSSLVSRAILLKPEGFSSLYEITDFITSRNAKITSSTVSKVLKSLEQELLVDKSKSLICVKDPEKLLDRLTEGCINSTERKARKAYKFAADEVENIFSTFYKMGIDYAACGFYAAKLKGLAVTNEITIFVKDIEQVRKATEYSKYKVEFVPDAEFGNLTITKTNDPGVWFNVSKQPNNVVVDNIELYLEMVNDTPRGPKIADILKKRILREHNE
jgi:hypothetical protein